MKKLFKSELATETERKLSFYVNLVLFVFFFSVSFFVNDNGFESFGKIISWIVPFGSILGLLSGSISYGLGKTSVKNGWVSINFGFLFAGLLAILVFPSFVSHELAQLIILNGILLIVGVSAINLTTISVKVLYSLIGMPYRKKIN